MSPLSRRWTRSNLTLFSRAICIMDFKINFLLTLHMCLQKSCKNNMLHSKIILTQQAKLYKILLGLDLMVSFQRTTETTVLISEFIISQLTKLETLASTNLGSCLFFLSLFVSSKRENSYYYRVHASWLRSRCSTCFTSSDVLLCYNVGNQRRIFM